MTDLRAFAKFTLDRGGIWHDIEKSGRFSMYKTQDRYMNRNNYVFTTPVYQIFEDGKRIFASTNYREACEHFRRLKEGADNDNG